MPGSARPADAAGSAGAAWSRPAARPATTGASGGVPIPPALARSMGALLARRSGAFLAAELAVKALTIALFLYAADRLGAAAFGRLAYVAALVALAGTLADFGLTVLVLKRAGARPDATLPPGEFRRALLLRGALGAVLAVGLGVAHGAGEAPREVLLAAAGGLAAVVLRGYPELAGSLLRAAGRAAADAAVRLAQGLAFLLVGVIALAAGAGVAGFGAAWPAAALCAAGTAAWMMRRRSSAPAAMPASAGGVPMPRDSSFPAGGPDDAAAAARPQTMRELVRQAAPFAALTVCAAIYFRVDTLMLAALRGEQDTGLYHTGFRFLEAALLVPAAAGAALLPLFSAAFARGASGEVRTLAALAWRPLAPLGLLGAVTLYAGAPWLVAALFGAEYAGTVPVLQVLAWTVPVVFLSVVTANAIAAGPRPQLNTWLAALMALGNVALNLIAIPRWGPTGAAATTLLTEAAGLIAGLVLVRRRVGSYPWAGPLVQGALAAGLALAAAAPVSGPAAPVLAVGVFLLAWTGGEALRRRRMAPVP